MMKRLSQCDTGEGVFKVKAEEEGREREMATGVGD